jgi:hypothetical protein
MKRLSVLFVSLLLTTSAFSYGHVVSLNQWYGRTSLIHDVINSRAINFCVSIENSPRFSKRSIATQVKMATNMWLKALPVFNQMTVTEVGCHSSSLDLKVVVKKDLQYPKSSAYKLNGDRYDTIIINSGYKRKVSKYSNKVVSPIDLSSILKKGDKLETVLSKLTSKQYNTLKLAKKFRISRSQAYYTSYKTIIHEVGHSFGLCDTLNPKNNCDSRYLTSRQPKSVMKNSTFMYLTSDDIKGIRSVYKRYNRQ